MKDESKPITNNRHSDLARLRGALSNPSRIALLEKLACDGTCIKNDFIGFEDMSKFTGGTNLNV